MDWGRDAISSTKNMKSKASERLKGLRDLNDAGLITALEQDVSDVVRHEAAFILGDRMREGALKSTGSAFKSLCVASLFDPSILVRHETALALANFKKQGSVRFLGFLTSDCAQEVRDSAAYAIEELEESPSK